MSARDLALSLRLAAGVALLALVLQLVGWQRVTEQLRAVSLPWFGAALACAIAANVVSAWRWQLLARGLDLVAPLPALLSAYAQGITVNTVLPGATLGGDALRALRLQQADGGNDLARAAASVALDRASGLWVLCALALLVAVPLAWLAPPAVLAARGGEVALLLALAAAALALFAAPLLRAPRVVAAGEHDGDSGEARMWPRWRRLHALLHDRRALLLRSLAPSFGVQLLSGCALWLCARAAGGDAAQSLSLPLALVVAAPVFLAAALPVSIGGFGPREAAAALAFGAVGAGADLGAAAALLYGLCAALMGAMGAPLLALAGGAAPRPVGPRTAIGHNRDSRHGPREFKR